MKQFIFNTVVLLFCGPLFSQQTNNINSSRIHQSHNFSSEKYKSALQSIQEIKHNQISMKTDIDENWEFIGGMNVGGRVNELYSPKLGGDTIYVGTANGGAFRSVDAGISWAPIFDDQVFLSVSSITGIPSNDSVLYLGTGDINFSDPSYIGNGVYKSEDYGATWNNSGLTEMGVIAELSVNPTNENELIAACLGNPFEKNNNRGVYKSNDGGQSWQQTLFVSDSSGVVDISRSTQNPDILFAANFNRMVQFGKRIHAGLDTKLYKSTDGGDTWTEVQLNIPTTINGRIGVEIAPSNDNYIYVTIAQNSGKGCLVLLSTDGGNSWQTIKDDNDYDQNLALHPYLNRSWEFFRVYVNPLNEEHIVLPGLDVWTSNNAGLNWNRESEYFRYNSTACIHDVLFDENNDFIVASAHGVFYQNGVDWLPTGHLPITQFYDIDNLENQNGYYMGAAEDVGLAYGNTQDMFAWQRDRYYPENNTYKIFAEDTSDYFYTNEFGLSNKTNVLFEFQDDPTLGSNPGSHYSITLGSFVFGSNRVNGVSNLPNQNFQIHSNPLVSNNANQNEFYSISEIERSVLNPSKMYTGSTNGKIYTSSNFLNGPASFSDISNGTILPNKTVSDIKLSYQDDDKVFVAYNGYFNSDTSAYLFTTNNGGGFWYDISGDLPNIGINSICIANGTADSVLFVATDGGVFISQNAGQNWNYLGTNMPVIAVKDIEIDYQEQKLIAGTFGRSMYSYDISFLNLVEPALGITEENLSSIQLYPNPAQNQIYISGSDAESFIIMNTMGKMVMQGNLNINQAIYINTLSSGVYFIKVRQSTKRFVISR